MDEEPSDLFGPVGGSDADEPQEMVYESEEDNEPRPDEAIEVPDSSTVNKPVKPKRVIKNPQPKLDPQRLMGPRGIGIIENNFKKLKFKGRGHETEDLNVLMKQLEHWAHRLYPKSPFDQTIKQIEKLGMKKTVQVQMKKLRQDMFNTIMPDETKDQDIARMGDDVISAEPVVDIFDQLVGNVTSSQDQTIQVSNRPMALSEEQKERMERNKRVAAEKRLQRLKLQAIDNPIVSQNSFNCNDSAKNSQQNNIDSSINIDECNLNINEEVEVNKLDSRNKISEINESNKKTEMEIDNNSDTLINVDILDNLNKVTPSKEKAVYCEDAIMEMLND